MGRSKAELMRESRRRKAERGEAPWRPDLAPSTRAKAERVAAERGISPAAAVDALVAEAPDGPGALK